MSGTWYKSDATHTTFSLRHAYYAQPQNHPWRIDAVGCSAEAGLTDSNVATLSRTKIVQKTSCVRHFRWYNWCKKSQHEISKLRKCCVILINILPQLLKSAWMLSGKSSTRFVAVGFSLEGVWSRGAGELRPTQTQDHFPPPLPISPLLPGSLPS
jgi:hypothetical protein